MKNFILTKCLVASAAAGVFMLSPNGAQAAVSSNDLAIIGADLTAKNGSEFFSWIALNDIAAGEVLYFTDSSYKSGGFEVKEGLFEYTVQAGGISAGTVVKVDNFNPPSGYTSPLNSAYHLNASIDFTTSGDQLLIFQDNDISDTAGFTALWAVNLNTDNWTFPGPESGQSWSELYPGLTEGVNALALGLGDQTGDDSEGARFVLPDSYGGNFVGTADELRALIQDEANWEKLAETSTAGGFNESADWVIEGIGNVTIIPEPSSTSLLFLGALGCLLRRKRS